MKVCNSCLQAISAEQLDNSTIINIMCHRALAGKYISYDYRRLKDAVINESHFGKYIVRAVVE